MTTALTYIQSFAASGGPTRATGATINIESYDIITITVAPNASTTVSLQPTGGNLVQGLLMQSNNYTNITYKVNGGDAITLDAPHMYLGPGQVALLGAFVSSMQIINGSALPAAVNIMILRFGIE